MTLNPFKCNYLTPLHLKGLRNVSKTKTDQSVETTKLIAQRARRC